MGLMQSFISVIPAYRNVASTVDFISTPSVAMSGSTFTVDYTWLDSSTEASIPPIASNVTINGTISINETITFSYDYYSPNGTTSGDTTYSLYQADDKIGTNSTLIYSGITASTTIPESAGSKYLILEVSITDINGVESLQIGISNYSDVVYAPFTFDSMQIESDKTSVVVLRASEEITGTSAGYSVEVNGSGATISSYELLNSTMELTLASAVTSGDSVTISYSQVSGDTIRVSDSEELDNMTGETVSNYIGDTYTDTIKSNFKRSTQGDVSGNWNNLDVFPTSTSPTDVAVLSSDLIRFSDSGSTGVSVEITDAFGGISDDSDAGSTTNFPNPAYNGGLALYLSESEYQYGQIKFSGLSSETKVRIITGHVQRSGPGDTLLTIVGKNTIVKKINNTSKEEHMFTTNANSSGEIYISMTWIDDQFRMNGVIIEK